MQDAEQHPTGEVLDPEWEETIRKGITEQLDSFEVLFPAIEEKPASALNLSPFSFSNGADEREYSELSQLEQAIYQTNCV